MHETHPSPTSTEDEDESLYSRLTTPRDGPFVKTKPKEKKEKPEEKNLDEKKKKKMNIKKMKLKKGRCTPMGTPECPEGSPQYNLAKRFKSGDIHKDNLKKGKNPHGPG